MGLSFSGILQELSNSNHNNNQFSERGKRWNAIISRVNRLQEDKGIKNLLRRDDKANEAQDARKIIYWFPGLIVASRFGEQSERNFFRENLNFLLTLKISRF
jgi:hypothetical protein